MNLRTTICTGAFYIGSLAISCVTAAAAPQQPTSVPEQPLGVSAEKAFPSLKFDRPILLTHAGDGSGRIFIAGQRGQVFVLGMPRPDTQPLVFFDWTQHVRYSDRENEEGFLGMAFHPQFKQNGQFFVFYTTTDARLTNVISRFRMSRDDPNRADPDSEEVLMRIPKPFWNHNGGTIAFGPDGYLYIALGDGGKANDPFGNGQNLKTLLGSILRIDVDHECRDKPYAIPSDNPFVKVRGAAPEIWAYGLRNVWRFSFDRQTGACWAADVGQDLWEEIDIIVRGGNYGWNLREGQHVFGPKGSPPRANLIEPIWEYPHTVGKSITGGVVYRGQDVPQLTGLYLYADYVSGSMWALDYDFQHKRVRANYRLSAPNEPVMSFGEDEEGEAYFTTEFGNVYRFQTTKR